MEQNISQCSQGDMACRKSVLPFCFTASGALQPLLVAHSGSDVSKISEDSGLKALWGTSERERETTNHHLFLQNLKAPSRRDMAPPNPPLVAHPPPPENLRCVRRINLSTRMMTVQPGANRQVVCLRCCNPTNNHDYCADDVLIT